MIETIKNKLATSPYDESIYLISKLTNEAGFFTNKGKLLYIVRNSEELSYESMDTEFLSLRTHVFITTVENQSQFESGYYNIIVYKGEIEETNFEGFVRLCITYCNSTIKYGLIKFFYSLVDLFQLPKEQNFKNLLGLFGELIFIDYIYLNFRKDISVNWHQGNDYDKYDFVCKDVNFEVKCIISEENIVKIKHDQIFNDDNNYIVIVKMQKDISGITLNELINIMRNKTPFSNNYQFQYRLELEKKRIFHNDADNVKLKKVAIYIYKVANLENIKGIPERITGLTYKFDFTGLNCDELNSSLFN